MTPGNSTPEHHSTTLLHMWDAVSEAFDITMLSPNTLSAIIRKQTDPSFVRKQHPTSILGRPFCMISCPSVTESLVLWCTMWCLPWSSVTQISIIQSSPNSLMRYGMSCSLFDRRIQIWSRPTQPTVPSFQKSQMSIILSICRTWTVCAV